jgi:sugar lactone lactonase YvrE
MERRNRFRIIGRAAGVLVLALVAAMAIVKVRYGGGRPYPDLSTPPKLPESTLETIVELDYPPGSIAVSRGGRIFFAYHSLAHANRFSQNTVFELKDGKPVPFPDAAFQTNYHGVQGMTVDQQNRLWCLEPATLERERTHLFAFDLNTGAKVFDVWFAPKEAQFAQDLQVSPDGATVYLADTGLFHFIRPGLIVFDVATKTSRRFFEDHPSTQPEDWLIRSRFGPSKLAFGLVTFALGLDGIALSQDGRWLFYAPLSHHQVFKVPTAALLAAGSDAEAANLPVAMGNKPLSDGIAAYGDGNLLITDVEHGAITRMNARGELETLVQSGRIVWADGVVLAADGRVLFTDSAIPKYLDQFARAPSQEQLRSAGPYRIYRFHP